MTAAVQVVFESHFGNVSKLAHAVADEFGVTAHEVVASGPAVHPATQLLIVGGPTHLLTMSTNLSRRMAAGSGGRGGFGLRDWLASADLDHVEAVAAFGTRSTRFSGSAARSAARVLHRRGVMAIATADFLVSAQAGPLVDGELERVRRWAAALRGAPQ